MSAHRFSTGKQFHWCNTTHEVRRLLPGGSVSLEDIFTGNTARVELSTLVKALFDGELRFAVEGKHARPTVDGNASTESEYVDLADCPEHLVMIARYRLEVIQPLLALPPEARTESAVEERVQEVQATSPRNQGERTLLDALSVRSVYRWVRDYTQSGNDLRALIPNTGKRGGKDTSRLNPEVDAIIESVIQDRYYVREAVTTDDILCEVAVRIEDENRFRAEHEQLETPSRATVARRIDALDVRSRFATKHGKQAAKREFSQDGQTE